MRNLHNGIKLPDNGLYGIDLPFFLILHCVDPFVNKTFVPGRVSYEPLPPKNNAKPAFGADFALHRCSMYGLFYPIYSLYFTSIPVSGYHYAVWAAFFTPARGENPPNFFFHVLNRSNITQNRNF